MTYQITVEHCIAIYDQDVRCGVLIDRARLESAVAAPFQTWGGKDLFPSLAAKAARLAYGIAEAQAYSDGNKRLALLCTDAFLWANGTRLMLTNDAVADLILGIGTKKYTCDDLAKAFADALGDATTTMNT